LGLRSGEYFTNKKAVDEKERYEEDSFVNDDIPQDYWDKVKKSDTEEDTTFDPYAQESDSNAGKKEGKGDMDIDKPNEPALKVNPFTGKKIP
jgi:hypothetical protein